MANTKNNIIEEVTNSEYKYGFVTDIEADEARQVWQFEIQRL